MIIAPQQPLVDYLDASGDPACLCLVSCGMLVVNEGIWGVRPQRAAPGLCLSLLLA